jgi:hypothetical protein
MVWDELFVSCLRAINRKKPMPKVQVVCCWHTISDEEYSVARCKQGNHIKCGETLLAGRVEGNHIVNILQHDKEKHSQRQMEQHACEETYGRSRIPLI